MKSNSKLVALLSRTQGETLTFGDYKVDKIIGIDKFPPTVLEHVSFNHVFLGKLILVAKTLF